MNNNIKLKRRARLANLVANGSNFLINWRPFNLKPMRSMYNWAHKVRSNDPAWTEYLQHQDQRETGTTEPGSVQEAV